VRQTRQGSPEGAKPFLFIFSAVGISIFGNSQFRRAKTMCVLRHKALGVKPEVIIKKLEPKKRPQLLEAAEVGSKASQKIEKKKEAPKPKPQPAPSSAGGRLPRPKVPLTVVLQTQVCEHQYS
jgi:hypothetical protein